MARKKWDEERRKKFIVHSMLQMGFVFLPLAPRWIGSLICLTVNAPRLRINYLTSIKNFFLFSHRYANGTISWLFFYNFVSPFYNFIAVLLIFATVQKLVEERLSSWVSRLLLLSLSHSHRRAKMILLSLKRMSFSFLAATRICCWFCFVVY